MGYSAVFCGLPVLALIFLTCQICCSAEITHITESGDQLGMPKSINPFGLWLARRLAAEGKNPYKVMASDYGFEGSPSGDLEEDAQLEGLLNRLDVNKRGTPSGFWGSRGKRNPSGFWGSRGKRGAL